MIRQATVRAMIATSEIKISVLIAEDDADKAVAAVHAAFFPA